MHVRDIRNCFRFQNFEFLKISNCDRPFNTIGAMERAKRAVEKHYAVVGVLEDLNSTLTVLEHYVPKFFTGASQVYWGKIYFFYIFPLKY